MKSSLWILTLILSLGANKAFALGSAVQHDQVKSFDTVDDIIKTRADMQIIEVKDLKMNGLYFLALTAEEERDLFDVTSALRGTLQYKNHTSITQPRANAICNFLNKGAQVVKMSFVQKQGFFKNEQVMAVNENGDVVLTDVGSHKFVDFDHGGSKTWNPVYFEKLTCVLNKPL